MVNFSAVNGPSLQLLTIDGFDDSGRVRQRDSLPGMARPYRVAMPTADHRAVPRHAGCVQSRHRVTTSPRHHVTNSNNKTSDYGGRSALTDVRILDDNPEGFKATAKLAEWVRNGVGPVFVSCGNEMGVTLIVTHV
ncbi:hypothetical protein [Streptosporangium sp. NPDC000396]|uniref:hypothetical protein n=1 Tax=Streptosporangium sp. NPDC000396 TaxID=3366185 RepID=UPI0036A599C1